MDACLDRVSDVFLFVRIIRMGALVTEESEKRIDIFRHNRETKFVNVHVLVDCAIAIRIFPFSMFNIIIIYKMKCYNII